jgi:TonB-dependent receptor
MRRSVLVALLGSASFVALAGGAAAQQAGTGSVTEVVVTAPRQEVVARRKQEDAIVLLNIQSAETIAKYPDYNAAEALGRIPGLSLSSDTGEGRFVNIRGIDANLNGATYGGVVLLNTFPAGTAASGSGRAVEFDTIPTGAIDGIIVYKTLSPDREAEGLGGQIELTPRGAKNITRPFVEGDLGWGYESLHDHTGPFTGSLAAGVRFGFNNGKLVVAGDGQDVPPSSGWISNPTPFSFVITGSRKDDRRGVDDIEPSYANDAVQPFVPGTATSPAIPASVTADNVLGEVDFRRYDYNRRRFGYGGAFEFKPNDDHSYFARLDVAGYKETVHKNHFYARIDGNPTPLAGAPAGTFVDTFVPEHFEDHSEETHRNTIFVLGGQDRFNKLELDYRAGYSRATYVENFYKEALWYGPGYTNRRSPSVNNPNPNEPYVVYNNANPHDYSFIFYNDASLTSLYNSTNASQYVNPRLRQYFEADTDEEYSYAINAKYPVDWIGEKGQVKFGLGARLRDKAVTDFGAQSQPLANLSSFAPSTGAGNDYYFGRYPNGPFVPQGAVDPLFTAPLTPSLGRDFSDGENVYAGYAMYTVNFGKLGVLAGARVEQTDATYGNFLTVTDAAGNATTSFINHKRSYTNIFPSVQLKYEVRPNLLVRATYSTGIARPGFSQAGGNAGVDFTTSPRPQYSTGNPNLKPTTGNNFDLDVEYYLPSGGIVQLGVFDKEFDNYIFRHARVNIVDPIFQGQAGDFITYANESAYARGVELAYHQKFSFLPGDLRGFGADANVTIVDSRFLEYDATQSGKGLNEYGSLPGTSHATWNVAAFYELNGLNARLSAEYVGKSLFGLQGDKQLDTIQTARLTMDFASSYDLTRNLTLYFNAKNLLDTPLRYNDGSNNRPQQIEYYAQTYEAGVRFKF